MNQLECTHVHVDLVEGKIGLRFKVVSDKSEAVGVSRDLIPLPESVRAYVQGIASKASLDTANIVSTVPPEAITSQSLRLRDSQALQRQSEEAAQAAKDAHERTKGAHALLKEEHAKLQTEHAKLADAHKKATEEV